MGGNLPADDLHASNYSDGMVNHHLYISFILCRNASHADEVNKMEDKQYKARVTLKSGAKKEG